MVLIHVKRGDKSEFLFETTVHESNDALIRELCHVHNTRLRLAALAVALPALAKHGAAKPPAEQGLDQYQELLQDNQPPPPRGPHYDPDPLGLRTGEGVGPELAAVLGQVAEDARQYISSRQQVQQRVCMRRDVLAEKLANVRGAVTMAFPMGLPAHDPIRHLIEAQDVEDALTESAAAGDVMPEDSAELWWAGKQFFRDQHVRDLIGRNEKTTLIVKLQRQGAGMPAREPAVSEDERKAMMAFYFKKQEELKKLADDDAEDYMTSEWADPRALKNALRGTQRVRPF